MTGLASTAMALAMLAAFLLIAGGVKLSMSPATRARGALMFVAALVLIANVAIWTI